MNMKIADIKAYPMSYKVTNPSFNSVDKVAVRHITLVKVIADDGSYGWGEGYGYAVSGISRIIETYVKDRIVGEDAFRIEYVWQKAQTRKGLPLGALSGVDMALWDLKAKALGVPLYDLLGGKFFDDFYPYGSGLHYKEKHPDSMEELEKEVATMLTYGFKSIKMKVGFGTEMDKRRVRRAKELIGDKATLKVDANQAYNISTCMDLLPFFEEMDIKWLEEPLPWHSFSSYKDLTARYRIPIAAGEAENTMQGFVNAIQERVCDIIQPDLAAIGGITPMKRIAPLAFANNIVLCPHVFATVMVLPAMLQFMCSQPNYNSLRVFPDQVEIEWDANPNSIDKILLKDPLEVKNGVVKVPCKPGLGVEVNEEAIQEFLVE